MPYKWEWQATDEEKIFVKQLPDLKNGIQNKHTTLKNSTIKNQTS